MTKGGLYIPLPEHIEIFCSTSHFAQCHQYIRGKELLSEAVASGAIYDDSRRRHRRIKEEIPVSIAACDVMGNRVGDFIEETTTFDLSIGGMCCKSKKEVPSSELLLLMFREDNLEPAISGIGEVKWCSSDQKSLGYKLGIAFKTKDTGYALNKQLGLITA
jgi:hypothetical protein